MPLTVPSGLLTRANFITTYLKPLVDATETAAAAAQTRADEAQTTATAKYTKPVGGIPTADLVGTVVTSSVSGVKVEPITETAYNALATKAANTLYIRTGA